MPCHSTTKPPLQPGAGHPRRPPILVMLVGLLLALVVYALRPGVVDEKLTPSNPSVCYASSPQPVDADSREPCRFYAMMIDAGSTGTRIHIFKFKYPADLADSFLELDSEVFLEVKPGLATFGNEPALAADSLLPLVKLANETVPPEHQPHTPLALRATAGFRLLEEGRAEGIVAEIRKLFRAQPFLTGRDAVGILSGRDEGVFAWFTLNFLLDRLRGKDKSQVVALDLGGASTQVTFRVRDPLTLATAPPAHLHQLELTPGQKGVTLYSHSYLGNGLIEARVSILNLNNDVAHDDPHTPHKTQCLPPHYIHRYTHHRHYVVAGAYGYSAAGCLEEVLKFVGSSGIYAPVEMGRYDVYGFSYFHDRAKQAGLVSDGEKDPGVRDILGARGRVQPATVAPCAPPGKR